MPSLTNAQITALNDHLRTAEALAQAMGLEALTPDGGPGPLTRIKQVHAAALATARQDDTPPLSELLALTLAEGLMAHIETGPQAQPPRAEPPASPDILDSESPSSL